MPSPQLAQLKNQLTQDLSQLTTSFAQLRAAQVKFRECINNIRDGVAAKKEGFTPIPHKASVPRRVPDGSTSLTKKMACLVHELHYAHHLVTKANKEYLARIRDANTSPPYLITLCARPIGI